MASVIEISYKTVTSCTEPSARRKDLLWSLFLADNYQFMTFNAFSFNGLYLFSFNGTVNFVIVTFVWSTMCISVSVLTLTAISVERWYAICRPLSFRSTSRRARLIIIIIWIISFLVAVPEFMGSTVTPHRDDTVLFSMCYPALWDDRDLVVFQICLMIGLYFLPLVLMGFAYAQIAVVLWKSRYVTALELRSRQPVIIRRQSVRDCDVELERRKKAAKMLAAIVVLFALCYLPNHTLNILRYLGKLNEVPYLRMFALLAHWAAFLNSCINPVIYNFMSDKFRKEFCVAVYLCSHCGRSRRPFKYTYNGKILVSSTDNRN